MGTVGYVSFLRLCFEVINSPYHLCCLPYYLKYLTSLLFWVVGFVMKLQFLILVIINFLCFYLAFNLFLLSFLSIFSLPNLPDALQLYRFSKRFHAKINHVKLFVNKQTILYD